MNALVLVATADEFVPYIRFPGMELKHFKDFDYLEGFFGTNRLVVVKTGIGKVSAAIATSLFCNGGSYDLVINAGLCGSLVGDKPGKLYFATAYVEHDLDLSPLGEERYQIDITPSLRFVNFSPLFQAAFGCEPTPAMIATGDSFLEGEHPDLLKHGARICDMEVAAVIRAFRAVHCAATFLSLKMVSDSGDSSEYQANLEVYCIQLAEGVIKLLNPLTCGVLLDGVELNLSKVDGQSEEKEV